MIRAARSHSEQWTRSHRPSVARASDQEREGTVNPSSAFCESTSARESHDDCRGMDDMGGGESGDTRSGPRSVGRRAGGARRFLPLLSLYGFAVTQPLLDLLGRYPQFFVARGTSRVEVLCLVAILSLGAPAIAYSLIRLCGRIRPAFGRWVFQAGIALGAALFILLALKRVPHLHGSFRWLGMALLGGAAFALAHARWNSVRLFLRILAPSPLIFALVFLAGPPMRAFWSGVGTAASATRVGSPAPVVMVVFDELPLGSLLNEAGEIDGKRFPHFADLARDANWYRNATTVADSTELSVPAILTGRYPTATDGRLATSSGFPRNVFTLLADHYDMRVFESVTHLCPTSVSAPNRGGLAARVVSLALDVSVLYLHLVIPSESEWRLPRVDQTWRGFVRPTDLPIGAKRNPAEVFSAFLESVQPSPRPTFSFIHLQLPHVPWVFLPSGKQYLPWRVDYTSPNVWDDQTALVELGFQRHVLQVMLVDRLLGRLVKKLKELDQYDRTLLIVLSDHGASFRPGGDRRAATPHNFRDVASIPLLIKTPGQRRGRVLDTNAETIDVVPSLADLLAVEPRWTTDGQSLFSGAAPQRTLKTILGGSPAGGLVFTPDMSSIATTVVCKAGAAPLKIGKTSLRAYLEEVTVEKDRVLFAGWAADPENERTADSILVFVDGRQVFRGTTGLPRPDVSEAFTGRHLANAGFFFAVGSASFEEDSEVRVIAFAGGRAAEVRYPKDFPWRRRRPEGPFQPISRVACDGQEATDKGTRLIRVWTDEGQNVRWPAPLVELARASTNDGLFRFPPCGELVGRQVAKPSRRKPEAVAYLDDSAALLRVDPQSGYIPAAIRGRLEATRGKVPRQVAVALNGVVAGLAPTFLAPDGGTHFLVPVPETALREGPNQIGVYGVGKDGCHLLPIVTEP